MLQVDGLDLIIGGHTNTFLWSDPHPAFESKGPYPTIVEKRNGKKTLVVQTNGYGRYLGNIELSVNWKTGKVISWSGHPILLRNSLPMDQALKSMVGFYREQVMNKMDTKAGNSMAFMDGGRPKCRLEECSFGNFVTDAMADEMNVKIAFVNSGAIKGSFEQGNNL